MFVDRLLRISICKRVKCFCQAFLHLIRDAFLQTHIDELLEQWHNFPGRLIGTKYLVQQSRLYIRTPKSDTLANSKIYGLLHTGGTDSTVNQNVSLVPH